MRKSNLKVFLNGIIMENPILVLMLGTCPTLAITNKVSNAFGMGLAFVFVLLFSNLIISLIRKIVPNEIRIPVYIVIIATLVSIVKMLLHAYLPEVHTSLGGFISLITVNCIILGRAESFASNNKPGKAVLDALGMSIGFTLGLFLISFVRELLGAGKITIWEGIVIDFNWFYELFNIQPIHALVDPTIGGVGGFIVYGLIIGVVTAIRNVIVNYRFKKLEEKEKILLGGVNNV